MNYLALMMQKSQSEEQVVDFVKNVGEGEEAIALCRDSI